MSVFDIDAIGLSGTGAMGAIKAWVGRAEALVGDIEMASNLVGFLKAYSDSPLDVVARALRENILETGGPWNMPNSGEASPSDGYSQVHFLGVEAWGQDEIEVARNWLRSAKAMQFGREAA